MSTLGSLICPIVWTLAIRQVVRQPLPRVTPEKEYSEVPHQYGVDSEVSPPVLLVLNLTQLKSRGIRLS